MEQRRGGEIDMLHWFRLLSLDVTGLAIHPHYFSTACILHTFI
jgi:hypothetical protein